MALDCITDVENVGVSACKQFPQAVESFIKTPLDFTITAVNAATSASWQAAIVDSEAERVHLFPLAYDFENLSEEATRASSNLGKKLLQDWGSIVFVIYSVKTLRCTKQCIRILDQVGGFF